MVYPTNNEDTRVKEREMDIDPILGEFITYLATVKNYSPRTLPTYRSTLIKCFEETKITKIHQLTPALVEQYFADRIKQGYKVNSNFNCMVAIRAFLMFCIKRGYSNVNLALFEPPKRQRTHVEFITADEVNRMIEVIPRERDRLMVLILYTSGCRVGELVQLTVENISGNKFTVIAKGNKPHVYYFDPAVAERLQNFLYMEHITQGPVFRMTNGKPVGAPAVSNAIRKAVKAAQISKRIHPHTFRHGFATALLENGADPRTVQEMMGHESIQTTMRYMHVTDKRMEQSHQSYAPKVSTGFYPKRNIPIDKSAYL